MEMCSDNLKVRTLEIHPDENFPKKIDQAIKRIIEKEGIIKYKIHKRCYLVEGGNFLGKLYEIDIKGSSTTGDKELNILVKNIIDNEESVKVLRVSELYRNELFAYNELSKKFDQLQNEANIPLGERYKMVKTYKESDMDMVIMENMVHKGFKTCHRKDLASLVFLEQCFKNIARFHGLSFALKNKEPHFFNSKVKSLNQPYIFGEEFEKMVNNIYNITIKHVGEDLKEKVAIVYRDLQEKFQRFFNDETVNKCLCHGDYRTNNILIKEQDGEIQELIVIDYQLIQYGCPVYDLLYLIYLCTERDFRRSHLSDLKDLYYDTLDNYLKYFNIDVETVYPRQDFERVFNEKLDYGLYLALQLLPFLLTTEEADFDARHITEIQLKVDKSFKRRMEDLIKDFIEMGYI